MRSLFLLSLFFFTLYNAPNTQAHTDSVKLGSNEWLPYIKFSDQKTHGLAIDKLNQLSTILKFNFYVKEIPFKRVLHYAKTGKIDGVLLSANRPERQEFLYFSKPIFCERRIFIVPKGRAFDWQNKEIRKSKTLGIGTGFYRGPVLTKWATENSVKSIKNINVTAAFQLLNRKRIDFLVYSEKEYLALIQNGKLKNDQFQILQPALNSLNLHLGISKSLHGQDFITRINKAIKKLGLEETCT